MKKLLLILCCCGASITYAQDQSANAQSVQDSHHTIKGYIRGGTILDANNTILGVIKMDNGKLTIFKGGKTVGFIADGKEIQDASHKTLGYVNYDGGKTYSYTVTDANKKTLGFITGDGTIQDMNHNVMGYEVQTEAMWVAPYFFFFTF